MYKGKEFERFQFFSYFTYEGETCNAHSRPALEHLPARWSKIDGKCSRKMALNFIPIPVMLNLILALWENFDLDVRPLKINIFQNNFTHGVFSLLVMLWAPARIKIQTFEK